MADLLALTEHLPDSPLAPGDVLINEGDRSGRIHVLVEGSLEVRRGDVVLAVVTEPGACFGEMAVLLDQPHQATVVAKTLARVRVADDGAAFLLGDPEVALGVARVLAHRLDVVNGYLADIKAQYADSGGHLGLIHEVLADLAASRPQGVELGSEREPDPRY